MKKVFLALLALVYFHGKAVSENCTVSSPPPCDKLYNYTSLSGKERNDKLVDLESLDNLDLSACSPGKAEVFLCLAMFPECTDKGVTRSGRQPCRSFCVQIRVDCSDTLSRALEGLSTADIFDCTKYPSPESDCLVHDEGDGLTLVNKLHSTVRPPTSVEQVEITNCTRAQLREGFFAESDKVFAKVWIALLCTICLISTLVTLLTFCIDRSRFSYPWRPIIYLAGSFLVHSVSYELSLALGPSLITRPLSDNYLVSTKSDWEWAHAPCLIIFSLLYYTLFSSACWWVVLTLCWFFATGLKWGNEAIAQLAPFYHVVAWSVPLVLTISVLAAKVIGADDLTGSCFVVRDHQEESALGLLLGFIIPFMLILIAGSTMMIVGFFGIIRIRRHMQKGGEETVSLDKLIIRMGIFNVIYLIPAIIVIGCSIYELVDKPNWCPKDSGPEMCPGCNYANSGVFYTRIFFSLIIGILSGVWIWSKKTFLSWKKLLKHCKPGGSTDGSDSTLADGPGGSSQYIVKSGPVQENDAFKTMEYPGHEV